MERNERLWHGVYGLLLAFIVLCIGCKFIVCHNYCRLALHDRQFFLLLIEPAKRYCSLPPTFASSCNGRFELISLCFIIYFQNRGRMPRGRVDSKPRGRMTAYAFFVQTCREEHKKKHPDETVIFKEFSKKCAERWKVSSRRCIMSTNLTIDYHAFSLYDRIIDKGWK